VGNADPSTAGQLTLRYDDGAPVSTAAAPAVASSNAVPVSFGSSDAVSGVDKTVLWWRHSGADWSSGTYLLSGSSGTFSFNTEGLAGNWEFYTQAFDNAGNSEVLPASTTPAKAAVYVDATPPVISNVRVTEITYDSARISWDTSEDATGRIEYGLNGGYENSVNTPDGGVSQSLYLNGLLYPASYTFKIIATNRAGGSSFYTNGTFYVPPKMTTIGDWGVIDAGQPIVIEVSNPSVSSISYVLNGQTVTQEVSAGTPLEIYPPSGQAQVNLSLNVDGFTYPSSFVVDTATRTIRLARLVIDTGGLMSAPQAGVSTVDATIGQAAQEEMSNGSSRLYLGYYAGIDPAAPGRITNLAAASGPSTDQVALSWSAPGDDAYAGTAVKYDIRWSTLAITSAAEFSRAAKASDIPFPQIAGSAQTALISGLTRLVTYYFSIRAEDELGNLSELSNAASLFKGYVLAGTVTVNGVSEISFVSPVAPSIALIGTVSASGAAAIGSAAASGLTLAGNMYEIGPEGTFDPPAMLTFSYSTATLAALGLQVADIAVYEHFPVEGWVKLPGQVLDEEKRQITVPISRIASLFAIFGPIKDRAAPVTEISYAGVSYQAGGNVYINAGASVTLTAYDPVVYATSTGVAFTEYRIDPGTASAFVSYGAPFGLTEGFHRIEFRSSDIAGNLEEVRRGEVYVDVAAPLTEALAAGTTGQAGWYISAATVTLVSTDSLSGLATTYYRVGASSEPAKYGLPLLISSEGVSTVHYFAVDNLGNVETEKTAELKIDLTAPVVVAVSSPAANAAGWNNTDISVTFFGTDAVSGTAYCSSSVTVALEGSSRTVSGYCADHAGWSSTKTATVNIDTTAPSISYTQAPPANEFGWNSSSITLRYDCADALSGVKVCQPDIALSAEGVNISTLAAATDYAGNITSLTVSGVNIDLTQPVSSAALAGTFWNGWYSSPVAVTLTSTDALSGIRETLYSLDGISTAAYQQPFSVSADGAHLVGYNSVDRAGNSELQKSLSFSVDRTAPQTGYALLPRPNADGWNNTAVNVVFSGTDTLAGVEACSTGVVGANGLNQQLAGWCRDRAGNTGYSTATVSVDLLPPTVRATRVPMPNADGWNNVPVRVGFSAEDALSGVAFCTADKTIADEGLNQTVRGTCADKAGNTGAGGAAVSLDFTAPAITYTRTPAPNAAGWNNAEVTLKFACTDALSGIKSCPADITFDVEGVDLSTAAKSFDLAGNSTQTIISGINIDRTDPVIVVSSPVAGNVFVATKDVIRTFFMARDNLDPAPALAAFLVQTEDRGSPRGGRPDKIVVSNGQAIEPLDIDDGIWRLAVSATDFADNSAYLEGGAFEVIHDVLPPASNLAVSGPRFDGPGIIYLTSATGLTLNSLDDLVQAGDRIGLGVRKQVVKVGLEGSAPRETTFENPFPKQGEAFVSTFTLGSVWNLPDGRYNFDLAAEDILGNVETWKHSFLGLDNTPPAAGAALAGIAGENDWYISTVTVTLTAVDALSGVEGIFYRLDGAQGDAFAKYAGAIEVASEGQHTVWYYAKDNLGNTGAQKSAAFKIDLTSPTISLARSPLANANGWNNSDVRAVFTCSDNLSGVKSCPPEVLFAAEGAGQGTSGTAFDRAGNSSVAAITGINIDKTAPESSLAILGDLWQAAGNKYLSLRSRIALTAEDTIFGGTASGMEILEYQIDAGAFETYSSSFTLAEGVRTLGFRAGDRAGNIAIAAPEKFYVDGTGPVSALSVSGDQYHGAKTYVSLRSDIMLTAADPVVSEVASGVKATKYSVDNGEFGDYSAFKLAAEGKRLVSFYSTDRVANVEDVKTSELWVDATAPVTELSISGARHDADGLIYITKDSGIVLTAADPVSNETASGVLLTKYRVDGGNWQVYAGSFTITAEGRHTLEFHSLDRVQNTEAMKIAALAVDNTPPATNVTLGEPKFEAFGLPVLTPAAPITLAAADVVSAEVASGLKSISYETVNVASGDSSVHNYTAPFTLPQGTYDLRFWSVDNLGNTEQYKQIRFSVSTFQNDSLQAVGGLDMSGTADISGAVKSNASVELGGNARILGDVEASTITLTGKAQITGQQFIGQAVLSPEPIFLGTIAGSGGNSIPAAYLVDGKLVASSQAELTLTTGTYYLKGIELSGGSKVRIEGQVDIMVAGDISLSGGSSLNAGGTASKLNIFVNTPSSITVTGGGDLLARVYAPYAHMKLAGNGLLGGHYFVRTAVLSGTGNIIQAGETLPQTTAATGDSGGKKRVSAMAAGDGSYSVLSGPDSAFRLGEVYVFPNPALRGAAPVLHIETGIADRVKITFYTVSGRQAHQTTLTGAPAALDDGNGLSYAYEYIWRDNIPSGVYYYHIEAEKGGQKIKKSGKFGVVR